MRLRAPRLAQRPGKPMWFGIAPRRAARCSRCRAIRSRRWCAWRAMCCRRCTRPWACAAAAAERIALADAVELAAGAHRLPAGDSVSTTTGAAPGPTPCPTNGSGDFTALAGTDGFVELPPGPNSLRQGFRHPAVSLVACDDHGSWPHDSVIACSMRPPPRGHARPPAARPAHLGHGPLQLPLPLLHAARELPRALPLPEVRTSGCPSRRSCAWRACSCSWACASCASPAASRCCAPTRRPDRRPHHAARASRTSR